MTDEAGQVALAATARALTARLLRCEGQLQDLGGMMHLPHEYARTSLLAMGWGAVNPHTMCAVGAIEWRSVRDRAALVSED